MYKKLYEYGSLKIILKGLKIFFNQIYLLIMYVRMHEELSPSVCLLYPTVH